MKRNYYWAGGATLVVLGALHVSGVLATATETHPRGGTEPSEATEERAERDLAPYRDRLAALSRKARARSAAVNAAASEQDAPKAQQTETETVSPPENKAAELETMFSSDRKYGEEASRRESMLVAAFADPSLSGVRLETAECRSSTCRAEIHFADLESDTKTLRKLLLGPESIIPEGMSATIPVRNTLEDGSIAVTMYLHAPPDGSASGSDPEGAGSREEG